jgi:soluble cytochrome b562
MSQVTLETLAERVEKLEQAIDRLLEKKTPVPIEIKDWRRGIGLMAGGDDELHKQFDEALHASREAGRQCARESAEPEENGK